MPQTKRKFGLLIITCVVLVILLFAVFKTDILTHSSSYVSNENLSEGLVRILNKDSNFLIVKNDQKNNIDSIITFIYDNPELYWIDSKYHLLSIGDYSILYFKQKYEDIDKINSEISSKASEIISSTIKPGFSEYDKVLALHDWLCENVKYEMADDMSDQDIYGALIKKKALCAGYAKAFSYLLSLVDIKSEVISGDAIDNEMKRVPHSWNVVYINGKPSYFDVTWDVSENGIIYDWFGVPSTIFQKSHLPSNNYSWIKTNDISNCYYYRNGAYIENYSAGIISKQIKEQGTTFTIMCKDKNVLADVEAALNNKNEVIKIMEYSNLRSISKITYIEKTNSNCLVITFHNN